MKPAVLDLGWDDIDDENVNSEWRRLLEDVDALEDEPKITKSELSRDFSEREALAIREAIGADKEDLEQFRIGLSVEWEHVEDPETKVATSLEDVGKIVWAHLKEAPDYYTRLLEAKL